MLALWKKGARGAEQYPGIEICEWLLAQNLPTYVLGAAQGVLDKLNFPQIVGKHHGYFDPAAEQKIIMDIQQKKPKILLVALGGGKQERWIARYKKILNVPLLIGVGGSLDIISGLKPRAPKIFRILKLEWFYRLCREPQRAARQSRLPLFFWQVLKER
jgi:N-acetylglucosaminyldiphosphoundecaprenol N-acetyl-beta-D-mannosaminyltransferase